MISLKSAALVAAVFLAGCAAPTTQRVAVTQGQTAVEAEKQRELLVQDVVAERERMQRVHWQLATRATNLCSRLTHSTGMELQTLPKGDFAGAYSRLYGVTERPTVLFVVAGGPADLAGVKARDEVVSMWGLPVSQQTAKEIARRARSARTGETMTVQVRRAGQLMDLQVTPALACDIPAVLRPERVLNAYADGERIYITRGMMEFVRTDDELALVMGHEMAHNTMRHMDAKKSNAAAGMVGDLALAILSRGAYRGSNISSAAGQAYSQEFEAEADYVGLYMLANSGYSVSDAPRFWRRMATANPGSIKDSHEASHPSTPYRMVALEEAAKEIDAKRAAGAPLVPVRKDGTPFVAGQNLLPGDGPAPQVPTGTSGTSAAQ